MSPPTPVCTRRWGVVIAAGLITLMALPVVAAAAPGLGTLKSYRLPASTSPHFVTAASDGNVWFTVQGAFDPVTLQTPGSVARVTPRGNITEFAVCDTCNTNDIVQGPDGILYISDNDGQLRRITTSGEVRSSISPCGEVFCAPLDGVAADSTSIWFADFFNDRVGRFNVFAAPGEDPFTYFPAAGVDDVAVAPDGTVWFTGSESVGEIDPAVGVVSTTPLSAEGSRITVAPNGIGNGLMLGYLMYRSALVPPRMALLGLIGGPVLILSFVLKLCDVYEDGSPLAGLLTLPEAAWELSLGIYCAWKGFRPESPIARPEMAMAH